MTLEQVSAKEAPPYELGFFAFDFLIRSIAPGGFLSPSLMLRL
jgi:hypothetical protein